MVIGDFSNLPFLGLVFAGITLLVAGIATLLFALITYQEKHFEEQLFYESTTITIFLIDVKQNKVTYFNKSDLKHRETSDLVSFYNRFHPNDVDEVKNWIFKICSDPNNTDEYLEADIMVNNNKKPVFSLLKLLKFDPQIGVIHIETKLLKYITPNNAPKASSARKMPNGIVKRSVIMQIVNKNKSLRGYTYGIRFFYAKQKALSNNKIERHMTMTLKNVVYPFASDTKNPRQVLDDGGNELFLFDLRIASREDAMQLANSISHALKRQIEVNGFSGLISFAIGIVENGQYYQDFDTIMECVKEACISGQTNGNELVVHTRNLSTPNDLEKYTEQIEHIMKDNVLRYLFRPIIDVKTTNILGYFEYVRAYDSPFSNFGEMSKYAAKINKNLDLFAHIAKHVIPRFVSECEDKQIGLFLSISMADIENVVGIVKQIPTSEKANIIFVLDEQEVNENAGNVDILKSALKNVRVQGYHIALLLKDKNLLLDDSVYHLFSYFVVGSAMLGAIRKNNRIRLSTYALIESLLKYDRPIIATDLESWQAVELIIESGISLVSSEVVAPSNDMLLPLEKKKMEKLSAMADKYL